MTMTRQHFALIAAVLAPYVGEQEANIPASIAKDFADKLRTTNPNFNRERFLRACGVEA